MPISGKPQSYSHRLILRTNREGVPATQDARCRLLMTDVICLAYGRIFTARLQAIRDVRLFD
jgi:hypothetical protein